MHYSSAVFGDKDTRDEDFMEYGAIRWGEYVSQDQYADRQGRLVYYTMNIFGYEWGKIPGFPQLDYLGGLGIF